MSQNKTAASGQTESGTILACWRTKLVFPNGSALSKNFVASDMMEHSGKILPESIA